MAQSSKQKRPFTLGIDIGGTGIKMMIMDANGRAVTKKIRELTPHPATVKTVCQLIMEMVQSLDVKYDRVSAGFPGLLIKNIIKTAPNMHSSWIGLNFQKKLSRITGQPAHVANDAVVQGYGDVRGKGVELVITLGTGVGSALFVDGKLVPNLQLAHIPFQHDKTYEQVLGEVAIQKHGIRKWNAHLKKAIALWDLTFNYDRLYLGGGYAQKINFKLPSKVKITKNIEGILGGIKLWVTPSPEL